MLAREKLWLTLGVKWEHNDFTGHEWQPSARLLFKINDKQTMWTSVSRAVRTPALFETSVSNLIALDPTSPPYPLKYTVNGSDDFDSEDLIAYEAGYRFVPRQNVSFDVAIFFNRYDKLRNIEPSSLQQPNILLIQNTLEGDTYGLELAADWKPLQNWRLQLGYSYMAYDLNVTDNSFNSAIVGITEGSTPEHQVSLLSTFDIADNLQLNCWLRYVGEIDSSDDTLVQRNLSVSAYTDLDLNIVWKATDALELMLVGQNLLDESRLEYLSEFSSVAAEVERSVYGKITYRF